MGFKLMAAQLVDWMLHKWPEEIELLPFFLKEAARKNDKRPAYVEISVPDDWVKNIKGKKNFIDTYVVVKVPAELFQRWTREQRGTALDNSVNAAQDVHAVEFVGNKFPTVDESSASSGITSPPNDPQASRPAEGAEPVLIGFVKDKSLTVEQVSGVEPQ